MSIVDRFWSKVDKSGGEDACWIWMAGKFDNGYGAFRYLNKQQRSHRVAWILTHGEISSEHKLIHTCCTKTCVNPSHLALQYVPTENLQRFFGFVNKIEGQCWEWTAGKNKAGYGKFYVARKHVRAHRYVYQMLVGEVPDNLCVCHHCDNPGCVNPKHLFLGTHKDNSDDKCRKGREFHPIGRKNGSSILEEKDVVAIREMYKEGFNQLEISRIYGVARATVTLIINGKNWRSVHLGEALVNPKKTSRYKGVYWDLSRQKWRSQIKTNRRITLGRFGDEAEAARSYDQAAYQYYGDKANLNFPEEFETRNAGFKN